MELAAYVGVDGSDHRFVEEGQAVGDFGRRWQTSTDHALGAKTAATEVGQRSQVEPGALHILTADPDPSQIDIEQVLHVGCREAGHVEQSRGIVDDMSGLLDCGVEDRSDHVCCARPPCFDD